MLDPLVWARLVHFAATMSVMGAVFFTALVAVPAFRDAKLQGAGVARVHAQLAAIGWIALAVTLLSGAAWLLFQAAQIADLPPIQALREGAAWTILTDTDFGHAWTIRLTLACVLALSLPRLADTGAALAWPRLTLCLVASATLVATLAWAGHAAAGAGVQGSVHLAADILHLVSAAAWVGALLPLALLLRTAAADAGLSSLAVARGAVLRFSTLGIASVATLVGSGLINTWVLAGSIAALTETDYGRLLLTKVALFMVMLLFAAINRVRLTPRLASSAGSDAVRDALGQIRRNTLIEAIIGAIVILIVSQLCTLPPGLEALE